MANTLILAGLVLLIVQIIKKTFGVASRYIPIVSLSVMIVILLLSWWYKGFQPIPFDTLLQNLVAVLTAMGMWSGTKAVIGK